MSDRLTLHKKMILGGIVAIIVPSLIAGFAITLHLCGSLQKIFGEKALLTAKNLSSIIAVTIEKEIDFASVVAHDKDIVELVAEKKYPEAISHIKKNFKRVKSDYLAVMISDTSGIVRTDIELDSVSIDISDRQYFMTAKNGLTGIEGPFISRRDKRQMMALSRPIYREKEFVGVVIISLAMEYLVETLSSIKTGKTDYAFITDSNGLIIAHPNRDLVFRVAVGREPGMEKITGKLTNRETGWEAYSFRGIHKIAGFTRLDLTGWNVVFTQERNETMGPGRTIIMFLLIEGGLFLCLVILIIAILFPKISSPAQRAIDLLQQLLEHSENAILTMGIHHRITHVNPAAEKIFGKPGNELTGTEPALENTSNTSSEAIWSELQCGRMWSGNVIIRNHASEPLTLAVMIIPVSGVSGTIESFVEIAHDITDEQKFQSRLVQTQKMEALGALAGGIAHDFNNILAAIFAYTEISLMVSGNPPETGRYLRDIMTATERARELVSQILTFSRKTEQKLQPLSPKLVINEALKLLKVSLPEGIDLQTTLASNATILAEPIQIHQVVVNLCTNAAYAIGQNTGTIAVSLEDLVVDKEFVHSHPGLTEGKHVLLKISDSGTGIDQAVLDKIFEPFYTTKPLGEGTGLGLSVVHGIVQKLNGIITVYSETGKGTVFNIIIPARVTETPTGGYEAAKVMGGTERILLVDDEKQIVEPVGNILRNLGYHVSAFTGSVQALNTFTKDPHAFDLVITDYSMPGMTSVELIGHIRKIRSDIPVIVNSGYLTKEINERFANIGVSTVLTKPINTYTLAEAIRNVLS